MRIWFDTEFIDTGREVHLLSIGMVREDGDHYYAEPVETDRSLACEWVRKHVFPHLEPASVKPRQQIRDEIVAFCGYRPELWAYYGSYDWLVLCQLFGRMLDVPDHWPNHPMDVQQVRVELGVRKLPEQAGPEHNALADAIWTKQAWEFLQERKLYVGELSRLERFALAVLEEARGDSIGYIDGGWLQDKGEELGVLVKVPVTEPCGELCQCAEYGDFPQDCLRYSDEASAARSRISPRQE